MKDNIETLNDLIETCKDGEYGFKACADHADSPQLKKLFADRARECAAAAAQLQSQVRELGGSPDESGSVTGSMHRGWVAVKSALSTYDDKAVLEECERGEDAALEKYREAMKSNLPEPLRGIIQQQYEGVKRNHDEIRRLRDAA